MLSIRDMIFQRTKPVEREERAVRVEGGKQGEDRYSRIAEASEEEAILDYCVSGGSGVLA